MTGKRKRVKDVTDAPVLFYQRMATQEVQFKGSDAVFHVEAIPATVQAAIQSRRLSDFEAAIEYVRFGLARVQSLTDEAGKPVKLTRELVRVGGRDYHAAPYTFLDSLPATVINALCVAIIEITSLDQVERLKLDFTTASN